MSWVVVAAHTTFVFLPVFLAAAGGVGLHLVGLWAWFGLSMSGLLNLMHEAAHCLVFRERRTCEWLGRWLLGPLSGSNFDGYRDRHWRHHHRLGADDDSKDAYLISIEGWRLVLHFARCLALLEAFRKFRHQLGSSAATAKGRAGFGWALRTAVVQIGFLASLVCLASLIWPLRQAAERALVAYSAVYLYGLMSLTVFIADLRAIAEHQQDGSDDLQVGRAVLRNFRRGLLARFVFGAYGFSEHATHHLQPGVPYYLLPAATTELAKGNPRLTPSHDYSTVLWRRLRARAFGSCVTSFRSPEVGSSS